jgi:hypothetical protein
MHYYNELQVTIRFQQIIAKDYRSTRVPTVLSPILSLCLFAFTTHSRLQFV